MYKLAALLVALFCLGCQNHDYMPKPRGYYRIDLPQKEYIETTAEGCPYTFEIPRYAMLVPDQSTQTRPCWKNLDFHQLNARLHLSYFAIGPDATFNQLTEDARSFVFKHTSKATAIDQAAIAVTDAKLYGIEYVIKGNTASSYQFYVSDSTSHYLRGALYFNEKPNLDSIQPVLDFLQVDIRHLIHTIRWK